MEKLQSKSGGLPSKTALVKTVEIEEAGIK